MVSKKKQEYFLNNGTILQFVNICSRVFLFLYFSDL